MRNEIIEWIKTIALSIAIAVLITTFVKPTIVKHNSMNSTLHENDFLIISRLLYKTGKPNRNDIIVFKSNLPLDSGKNKLLIKRIVAVEGDTISIKNGLVYLNGEILKEPYIRESYTKGEDYDGKVIKIPSGRVFVMGDNRSNSIDSRYEEVSLINVKDIVGKAIIRLYPLTRFGWIQ